ncbi:MAG TPA: hypothetical protein VFQ91_20270 [Bryobacteraceae bacterium]|nr:hypothetical protein [Bryobacteraceae bacterium]
MQWRFAVGALLLAMQAGAIVRARFANDRYFCWAPFDQQTKYSIGVSIGDEALGPQQIRQRYRRPAEGVDNRSAEHLFDIITRAEQKFEQWGRSRVVVRYRINGHEEREWRYPQ